MLLIKPHLDVPEGREARGDLHDVYEVITSLHELVRQVEDELVLEKHRALVSSTEV